MDYETEEQQVEALKAWWTENGKAVIAGLLLGAGAIGGWQGWQAWQQNQAVTASDRFAEVLDALDAGNAEQLNQAAGSLTDDSAGTLYAAYGKLAAARQAVADGDLEAAAGHLAWVADEAEGDVALIARIRLARVRGAQGDAGAGLGLLPDSYPESFTGLIEEARGDLLAQEGDLAGARKAYEVVRDSGQAVNADNLTMKLNELSGLTSTS